jgi:nitrogen fixation protein NifB
MNMMRHCRQCRADAVGLLGEDRGQEFTLDKIEAMDIDYEAAMNKRANVHAGIEAHRDALRAEKERAATQTTLLAPIGTPPARIAVTTKGGGVINEHFGHAKEFLVYEASPEGIRFIGPRKVNNAYCVGPDVCPDGAEKGTVLEAILDSLSDCSAVVSAKVGIEPWSQLEAAGITPNGAYAMDLIEDAVKGMYSDLVGQGWSAKDLHAQAAS